MNKPVPTHIGATMLHPRARQRTHALLADLEAGIPGITTATSAADRLRLIATYLFTNCEDDFPEPPPAGGSQLPVPEETALAA